MSMPLSFYQKRCPDLTDLLLRYASLASWLSESVQSQREARAEDLWPRFLSECTRRGVASNAYPFTADEGQGLADLKMYVQLEREMQEDEGMASTPTQPVVTPSPSIREQRELVAKAEEDTEQLPSAKELVSALPTAKTPSIPKPKHRAPQAQRDFPVEETDLTVRRPPARWLTNMLSAGQQSKTRTSGDIVQAQSKTDLENSDATQLRASANELVKRVLAREQEGAAQIADEHGQKEAEAAPGVAEQATEKQEVAQPVAQHGREEAQGAVPVVEGYTQNKRITIRPAFRRRDKQGRPRTRRQLLLSWTLLILILAVVVVPAISLVTVGIGAYITYHELNSEAHDAVNQLLALKGVFSGSTSHPGSLFAASRLQQAQKDFTASGQDFQQMQHQLHSSLTLKLVAAFLPQYRTTLSSVLAASVIGGDVAKIGKLATTNALQLAPALSSAAVLSASKEPFLTQPMLTMLATTLDQASPLLHDIQIQAPNVVPDTLPISASEKVQLGQALQLLPQMSSDLGVVRALLGNAGWLLGVDQPRTFLVQTMDPAELRGTGGFTGQYGELKINAGQVAPFNLVDISLLEYTNTSVTQGQSAPGQYRSWWPFANWGLRDSNISADFPTSAQTATSLYQQESGHAVDGLISFTPVVIEHILSVIGPVQVPGYNTTVTAQNLEDQLHYYQLNNAGIYKQFLVNQQNPNDPSTSARKKFTGYLATLFLQKLHSASPSELLSIAHQLLEDLKTKDLQVYFTNPSAENVLMQYGDAGQLDRSLNHDGLYVVQQDLGASKASQYVQTNMHDAVTLDGQGGATHQLQIQLVYHQAGPVYGYDTYYDYLRVYVPPNSRFLAGDGFSSGTPLCGGSYGDCPATNVYPGGELTCPEGQYQPGAFPPALNGSDGLSWEPLQTLSGPTNVVSDEPGRAMYGGWVTVPKNCTINVTLSWYVPPLSSHGYSLLVQRQAGTFPNLDLSIQPGTATCTQTGAADLSFTGILVQDRSFALPDYKPSTGPGC